MKNNKRILILKVGDYSYLVIFEAELEKIPILSGNLNSLHPVS